LDSVKPELGGVYAYIEGFPDQQLLDVVTKLSHRTGTPLTELIEAFGQSVFHCLAFKHSIFTDEKANLMEFMKSIESVIHKEVRKLYQNPNLLSIEWKQPAKDSLTLRYQSPRKLCHLADGLIRGAAEHYKTKINMSQTTGMHDGATRYTFLIETL
jgi:predicted hydrocarbon binding protein